MKLYAFDRLSVSIQLPAGVFEIENTGTEIPDDVAQEILKRIGYRVVTYDPAKAFEKHAQVQAEKRSSGGRRKVASS